MAMVQCNECGQAVSDKARTCPHCGIQYREQRQASSGCGTVFIVGFLVLFLGFCGVWFTSSSSPSGTKSPPERARVRPLTSNSAPTSSDAQANCRNSNAKHMLDCDPDCSTLRGQKYDDCIVVCMDLRGQKIEECKAAR